MRNLDEEVVRGRKLRAARHDKALLPGKERRSLKELLLAMPPVGEDADFERSPDRHVERTGVDLLNPFSA